MKGCGADSACIPIANPRNERGTTMPEDWSPPVRFYAANRDVVTSRSYRNDCQNPLDDQRRLLIKRTIRGCGVIYASGVRYELPAGTAFLIQRPGPYQYCYEGDGAAWEFEYVSMILPPTGDWLPPSIRTCPTLAAPATSGLSKQMAQIVDRVRKAGLAQGPQPRLRFLTHDAIQESAAAYQLYLGFLASYLNPEHALPPAVKQLRDFLHKEFSSPVQLSRLSRDLGYTPEALSRLFRKTYAFSPMQYLMRLRLEYSLSLLQTPNRPLKQIAGECGFDSLNYFCRAFRLHCGRTPGDYRNNPDPMLHFF